MQIIQKIRDKGAAIVIVIIALSLIGFILMDAKQGAGKMFGSDNTDIGKINGETVDYNDFNRRVKDAEEQYGDRGRGNTYQVRQQVWDQMITEKVLSTEFDKLALGFASKELSSILFSEEAPASIKQAFTDKESGKYDIAKAQQWWSQAKKSKGEQRQAIETQIIEPIKLNALYTKYGALISGGGYYPTWLRDKENSENKNFAIIDYVSIPYNVISDSAIKVSDKEIVDYLEKNKVKYKQEAGRMISYVSFSANPSAIDSAKALESLASLKPAFEADTNAKAFVTRNMSAITFSDAFSLKDKITATQKDSIIKLPINGVYGPYLDGKNFVLAKLIAIRQLPDSVKCRHILIGTKDAQSGQPTLDDSIAHKRADSITAAIQSGADFNEMVLKYSDDPGSKNKKGEYDFTLDQFGSLAKEFAETIFYGSTGDKKVVHTDFGWHYIEVMEQKKFDSAYRIAYMAKEILPSDETINMASAKATRLSGEATNLKALDAYISKNGLNKIDNPTLIKENDYQLGGLRDARQLIKWAFEAKQGEVSEPFSIDDQFVVAVVTKVQPEGLPDAETARPMVESTIKNSKKASEIIKKVGNNPTLESAANAYGKTVATAGTDSSITFSAQIINGIGQEPKLIGASFNKQYQSRISPPIEGMNGVYVLKVKTIASKAADTPEMIAQQVKDREKSQMQQKSYGWFEALKKLASVKDNRSKFL